MSKDAIDASYVRELTPNTSYKQIKNEEENVSKETHERNVAGAENVMHYSSPRENQSIMRSFETRGGGFT